MSQDLKSAIHLAVERYIEIQGTHFSQNLYHDIIALTERQIIESVLKKTANNKSKAANILGVSRVTLLKKIKSYQNT